MYYKIFLICIFIFYGSALLSQEVELESIYEKFYNNYDLLDKYTEQIDLESNPIKFTNINNLKFNDWIKIPYIDSSLATKIIEYKLQYGGIMSVYELHNIEGLNDDIILRISVYFELFNSQTMFNIKNIIDRFDEADHLLLLKNKYLIDKPKGYTIDNGYLGNNLYHNLKYRCRFYDNLSIGFVIEKDYGEEYLIKDNLPDFYSFHLEMNNIGFFDKLIIGDYKISSAEGLTISNDFPLFKQYGELKRYGFDIKPNMSNDKSNLFRGIALNKTLHNKYSFSYFISQKQVDGENVSDDFYKLSSSNGLHNTLSLKNKKDLIRESVVGTNVALGHRSYHTGITIYLIDYDKTIVFDSSLRNINRQINFPEYYAGYYYKVRYKNLMHYTEATVYHRFNDCAIMSGLSMAIGKYTTIGLIYRNYKQNFINIYNTAYSKANNYNEKGINMTLFSKIYKEIYLDIDYDLYRSEWLKYLINTPSFAKENYIKLAYSPNRNAEYYISYNFNQRFKNYNCDSLKVNPVNIQDKTNIRINAKNEIGQYTIKNRIEWCNINFHTKTKGILLNSSLKYATKKNATALYIGFCFFSTDSYNERIYAYENDLLYEFSIIPYYYKGDKIYLMIKQKIKKHITLYLKYSQTRYYDRDKISSGLNEIDGNKKREIKLQLIIK